MLCNDILSLQVKQYKTKEQTKYKQTQQKVPGCNEPKEVSILLTVLHCGDGPAGPSYSSPGKELPMKGAWKLFCLSFSQYIDPQGNVMT